MDFKSQLLWCGKCGKKLQTTPENHGVVKYWLQPLGHPERTKCPSCAPYLKEFVDKQGEK